MNNYGNLSVIAERKEGIGGIYIFTTAISIVLTVLGIAMFAVETVLAIVIITGGVALVGVSIYTINDYKNTPKIAITYNDEYSTIYVKNQAIRLTDIVDVSYRKAASRYYQYEWGSITVKTNSNTFKVNYIENCEQVEKALTKLVYEHRESN